MGGGDIFNCRTMPRRGLTIWGENVVVKSKQNHVLLSFSRLCVCVYVHLYEQTLTQMKCRPPPTAGSRNTARTPHSSLSALMTCASAGPLQAQQGPVHQHSCPGCKPITQRQRCPHRLSVHCLISLVIFTFSSTYNEHNYGSATVNSVSRWPESAVGTSEQMRV